MSNNLNVHIDNLNKDKFKSKSAIKKLKQKIKKNNYKFDDLNNFLKEGYKCSLKKNGNDIYVEINTNIKSNLSNTNENLEKRKKLKEKLKEMKGIRTGKTVRYANNLKKNIPKNILKSFLDLNKTFDIPVPDPSELINNPDKYLDMIKVYSSDKKLSPDETMNTKLRNYFKCIANHLKINPYEDSQLNMDKINEMAQNFYNKEIKGEKKNRR